MSLGGLDKPDLIADYNIEEGGQINLPALLGGVEEIVSQVTLHHDDYETSLKVAGDTVATMTNTITQAKILYGDEDFVVGPEAT